MTLEQSRSGTPVVGVALPIPEPWGSGIQRLRIGYGETRAADIPTHITLLPPTPLPADELPGLRAHLTTVAATHAAFQVVLRGTGTFQPVSDVVFIQVAMGVSSCERLERAVRSGPVERELAFPYHPHVTLVHDQPVDVLDRAFAELGTFAARFPATMFRLYRHDGDGVWASVEDYPLTG